MRFGLSPIRRRFLRIGCVALRPCMHAVVFLYVPRPSCFPLHSTCARILRSIRGACAESCWIYFAGQVLRSMRGACAGRPLVYFAGQALCIYASLVRLPPFLRQVPALCVWPFAVGILYSSGSAYLALSPAPYVVEIPRAKLGFAGARLLVLYTADLLFCPFSCSSPFFLCPPLFPWCFFLWRFSVFFAALRRGAARIRRPSC